MMRISLVGPPTVGDCGSTFPPLTLLHLATILDSSNLRDKISLGVFDLQLLFVKGDLSLRDTDLYKKVANHIGVDDTHLLLMPTMPNNLAFAVLLAVECKRRNPSLVVVVGGVHATSVSRELVESFPCIDIVVRGEGEVTLLELIEALSSARDLRLVKGLTFRDGQRAIVTSERSLLADLDVLPTLNLDLVKPLNIYQPERAWGDYAIFIDVGRGCPFDCVFCAPSRFWRHQFRQKSASRIIDEMVALSDRYGIGHFYFNQDDFTANRHLLHAFCNQVSRQQRPFDWRMFARMNALDFNTIELLSQAGCRGVFCGLESSSPERQEMIRKLIPLNETILRIHRLLEHGIECIASLIVGFPDEGWEELDSNLRFALDVAGAGGRVHLQLLTPHPQTPIWQQHKDSLKLRNQYYAYYDNSEFLGVVERELVERHSEIFTVFTNFPTLCKPFGKFFNMYYDYKRCINDHFDKIRQVLELQRLSMVQLHSRWRAFLMETSGRSCFEVVEDGILETQFPAFLEVCRCEL